MTNNLKFRFNLMKPIVFVLVWLSSVTDSLPLAAMMIVCSLSCT